MKHPELFYQFGKVLSTYLASLVFLHGIVHVHVYQRNVLALDKGS